MLLAGCGGGAYADTPRLADAGPELRDAQRPVSSAPVEGDAAPSGDTLQSDYPPEPGGPLDKGYVPASAVARPARTARPGARYALPPAAPVRPAPVADRQPQPAEVPPEVAASSGPRGTSGEAQRYDTVGYATWYGEEMQGARTASGQPFVPSAITAAHRTLPLGSIVEVTALDTGRTILALVNDRGPSQRNLEIDLSRGAAQALGVTATAPVRVRLVTASPQDLSALRSGRPASSRIDAPQALLVALRHKLPGRPTPMATVPAPKQRPGNAARVAVSAPAPAEPRLYSSPIPEPMAPRGTGGIFVQVAALSNEGKAKALATSLNGRVQRVGAIYRIQIGPYANTASAKAARDDVARRGYGDARIVQTN